MRKGFARLGVESLERRDTPSVVSDFYDVFTTDPVAGAQTFYEGYSAGAVNIVTGAHDAIVETVRVGGDLITIGATNRGQFDPSKAFAFFCNPLRAIATADANVIDPTTLNSGLFRGAAETAGNPQAAEAFDRQLVFALGTLGVGPLAVSGHDAVVTGDSTQFSQQAGGFGVMVLVPYAGGRAWVYLRGPAVPAEAPPAGAVVAVEGEFNPLARAVKYVEGAAPADAELATVNGRLQLARQIVAEEVQRLESIDPANITPAEQAMLRNLRNNSCAEAAVQLERAIATGEVNPLDPAGTLRQLNARDLLYAVDNASAAPPFRGAPGDLPQLLADQLRTPGSRALVVIERADGTPGHVLNAENVNGTIWLYEAYSGRAAPVTGQPARVAAVEAFYPLGEIAPRGGYSVIVVGP